MSVSLQADCESCFGLCCVVPAFAASADFAIDKDAGKACPNLQPDFRCGSHTRLRQQGFSGCAVYDCFGAGQKISQVTFGGLDWLGTPQSATRMFEVFPVMRQLHELLWYLAEALTLQPAGPLHRELSVAFNETARLSNNTPESLLALDIAAHRRDANLLLLRVSELVRAEARPKNRDKKQDHNSDDRGGGGRKGANRKGANISDANPRSADLIGADLRGTDLRGANLRGALLVGADLRGADLRVADLIGADFRGADLSGADLTESIFLTQSQLNAAKGDTHSKLPTPLTRPAHWSPKSL